MWNSKIIEKANFIWEFSKRLILLSHKVYFIVEVYKKLLCKVWTLPPKASLPKDCSVTESFVLLSSTVHKGFSVSQ